MVRIGLLQFVDTIDNFATPCALAFFHRTFHRLLPWSKREGFTEITQECIDACDFSFIADRIDVARGNNFDKNMRRGR